MMPAIWILIGAGVLMGALILWVIITEIRLYNLAQKAIFAESNIRYQHEQVLSLNRSVIEYQKENGDLKLENTLLKSINVTKSKGKRKKGKRRK